MISHYSGWLFTKEITYYNIERVWQPILEPKKSGKNIMANVDKYFLKKQYLNAWKFGLSHLDSDISKHKTK